MDVLIASDRADAEAAERMVAHHAEMTGRLTTLVDRLAAELAAEGADWSHRRDEVVGWCRAELLPHAAAEESSVYVAARDIDGLRPLVEAMVAEHTIIGDLVDELERATRPWAAVATAGGLRVLVGAHVDKENEQLLPPLVAAPEVSVDALLTRMHELTQEAAEPSATGQAETGHTCGCHEHEAPGWPELDARAVPHAIRHATIFGALTAVPPGAALVLVAPHDPLPLLAQIQERWPGVFTVSYLERGPEAWRLEFLRPTA